VNFVSFVAEAFVLFVANALWLLVRLWRLTADLKTPYGCAQTTQP